MARQSPLLNQRKTPLQARSRATYSAILEAAAQLLETRNIADFTADKVAERAGVSIGSLYQYFPNKDAIVRTIAEREEAKLPARPELGSGDESEPSALRKGIRAYINMLPNHPQTRKAALELMLDARGATGIGHETDKRFEAAGAFDGLSETERFVVSRAVVGVVQAAVLEDRADLMSQEFEDCLVRLAGSLIAA